MRQKRPVKKPTRHVKTQKRPDDAHFLPAPQTYTEANETYREGKETYKKAKETFKKAIIFTIITALDRKT